MPNIDHLKNALAEVKAYREGTACGYCVEVADTVADSILTTIETDALVHEIIRTKDAHPMASRLPEIQRSLHETRDLARSQLAPAAIPTPPRGIDLGIRSTVRSLRESIPRPRELLPF